MVCNSPIGDRSEGLALTYGKLTPDMGINGGHMGNNMIPRVGISMMPPRVVIIKIV